VSFKPFDPETDLRVARDTGNLAVNDGLPRATRSRLMAMAMHRTDADSSVS